MVDTFQALWILLLAFLPGALYVWAFEREAGGWGLGVTDRVLRFVGVSAVFHAGYPGAQDLYLVETVECEPGTGAFVVDSNDRPIPRGMGVLVRWDEVMYLEFIDSRPGG